jgi:hypothetical protein
MDNADFDTLFVSPRPRHTTTKAPPSASTTGHSTLKRPQPRPLANQRLSSTTRTRPERQSKTPYPRAIHHQFSPSRESLQKSRTHSRRRRLPDGRSQLTGEPRCSRLGAVPAWYRKARLPREAGAPPHGQDARSANRAGSSRLAARTAAAAQKGRSGRGSRDFCHKFWAPSGASAPGRRGDWWCSDASQPARPPSASAAHEVRPTAASDQGTTGVTVTVHLFCDGPAVPLRLWCVSIVTVSGGSPGAVSLHEPEESVSTLCVTRWAPVAEDAYVSVIGALCIAEETEPLI